MKEINCSQLINFVVLKKVLVKINLECTRLNNYNVKNVSLDVVNALVLDLMIVKNVNNQAHKQNFQNAVLLQHIMILLLGNVKAALMLDMDASYVLIYYHLIKKDIFNAMNAKILRDKNQFKVPLIASNLKCMINNPKNSFQE